VACNPFRNDKELTAEELLDFPNNSWEESLCTPESEAPWHLKEVYSTLTLRSGHSRNCGKQQCEVRGPKKAVVSYNKELIAQDGRTLTRKLTWTGMVAGIGEHKFKDPLPDELIDIVI
jgi:hypothetical protein